MVDRLVIVVAFIFGDIVPQPHAVVELLLFKMSINCANVVGLRGLTLRRSHCRRHLVPKDMLENECYTPCLGIAQC